MNEITNKQLFITMILIGVITIFVILSQNKNISFTTRGYNFGNSLGATAYPLYDGNNDDTYWYRTDIDTRTTYTDEVYRTPSTTTTTYYYEYPTSVPATYYNPYSNTGYQYQDQGYVPRGCESGTDYSTVDGQPCG